MVMNRLIALRAIVNKKLSPLPRDLGRAEDVFIFSKEWMQKSWFGDPSWIFVPRKKRRADPNSALA
ncbi:MAG: hypothetical protein DMG35_00915 [Acidobacteria bacterium]|nr:MAG: hypothetical protein AUH86_16815 [Acidobacteria bacterium 13_1_40CM_4_58_4]PYT64305.1 MAG: hypothetical protein DMG35_00915 [Acidobacteriota bacterium]